MATPFARSSSRSTAGGPPALTGPMPPNRGGMTSGGAQSDIVSLYQSLTSGLGRRGGALNITRARVGAPSREGLAEAGAEARQWRSEYAAPQETAAYKAAMGLAGERTGAALAEERRGAREATSRAGFTGGFGARGEQAAIARQEALATTGYEAQRGAQEMALQGYGVAKGAHTELLAGYNQQVNQANIAQAELDEAFNRDQISIAQYRQLSASVAAGLATAQARLNEERRQFDVGAGERTRAFGEDVRRFGVGLEAGGRDPSGRAYGYVNPAPPALSRLRRPAALR